MRRVKQEGIENRDNVYKLTNNNIRKKKKKRRRKWNVVKIRKRKETRTSDGRINE